MSEITLVTGSTVCESLANAATRAVFELGGWENAKRTAKDLPLLREFLQAAASARIQFPDRMKRIEGLLVRQQTNMRVLEGDLFPLLSRDEWSNYNVGETGTMQKELHKLSTNLYAIHAKLMDDARRAYEEATAI